MSQNTLKQIYCLISQIRNNISNYGDTIDTSNEYKYESLLISSIQEYYEFINKIKLLKRLIFQPFDFI